jgi:peptidyl-prolyl cis-trans isomerase C
MATIYQNPSLGTAAPEGGYTTRQEPDTRVPPKAAPVMKEIAVNGVAIPESEILAEAQNHPAGNPGAALRAAAQALVVRELLWQEAQRLQLAAAPAGDGTGRQETICDAAIRDLIEREVQVPTATGEECRRYYDRHPKKFRTEPLFEARHILLAAGPDDASARERAREEAEQLIALLLERPGDFTEMARRVSACPSREQGGNLGQLSRGSTVAEFETALSEMAEGAISEVPVESRFGLHIIALDRRIEGRQLPYEHVADRIAAWLEAGAWSKAVAQYIAVLAGRADIAGIALDAAEGPLIQ